MSPTVCSAFESALRSVVMNAKHLSDKCELWNHPDPASLPGSTPREVLPSLSINSAGQSSQQGCGRPCCLSTSSYRTFPFPPTFSVNMLLIQRPAKQPTPSAMTFCRGSRWSSSWTTVKWAVFPMIVVPCTELDREICGLWFTQVRNLKQLTENIELFANLLVRGRE